MLTPTSKTNLLTFINLIFYFKVFLIIFITFYFISFVQNLQNLPKKVHENPHPHPPPLAHTHPHPHPPTLASRIDGGGHLLIFGKKSTQDILIPNPPFIKKCRSSVEKFEKWHKYFILMQKIGYFFHPPRLFHPPFIDLLRKWRPPRLFQFGM